MEVPHLMTPEKGVVVCPRTLTTSPAPIERSENLKLRRP